MEFPLHLIQFVLVVEEIVCPYTRIVVLFSLVMAPLSQISQHPHYGYADFV